MESNHISRMHLLRLLQRGPPMPATEDINHALVVIIGEMAESRPQGTPLLWPWIVVPPGPFVGVLPSPSLVVRLVKANLTGVNPANVELPENRLTTANGTIGDYESWDVFKGFRINLLKPRERFPFSE
ncbi:hypothetical protein VNO77_19732 [Canavalia gladiata]|uniref:Uncharacterized protein n=1 Tax=Canavalia gladiata TaxID=3824 RepID=A0AAN9LN90_CANGL